MARTNSSSIKKLYERNGILNKIIDELKEKMKEFNIFKDKIKIGKQEHNASLLLINELGDDLPSGWSRKYVDEKKRYLYLNSSNNLHFWSANVSREDNDLEDLHPDNYDN